MTLLQIGSLLFLLWNSICDIRKKEIVPVSIGIFAGIRLLYLFFQIPDMRDRVFMELTFIAAGMLPGLVLYIVGRIHPNTIGQGDGLVLMVTGLYVGIKEVWEIVMWAFLLAGLWCICLLCLKKCKRTSSVPFVPFLLTGEVLSILL